MLTILWVLVLPNVDLDPAPPLNLEVVLFAVFAICAALVVSNARRERIDRSPAVYWFFVRPFSASLASSLLFAVRFTLGSPARSASPDGSLE